MTVASHSHNGTNHDLSSGTNPTRHVDIRTCPLQDIGPPRLRSRAVDTNCPTARGDAAQLGESVQSRRWRSGLVRPSDPGQWMPRLAGRPCREAGYALQRNMRSNRLFSHDICNILARLDIHNHNDLALHTLLKKLNLNSYVHHSLVC